MYIVIYTAIAIYVAKSLLGSLIEFDNLKTHAEYQPASLALILPCRPFNANIYIYIANNGEGCPWEFS